MNISVGLFAVESAIPAQNIQTYQKPYFRWHRRCFWDRAINSHTQVLSSWFCLTTLPPTPYPFAEKQLRIWGLPFLPPVHLWILQKHFWHLPFTQGKQKAQPPPKYRHSWGHYFIVPDQYQLNNDNHHHHHHHHHHQKVAVSNKAGTVLYKAGTTHQAKKWHQGQSWY